MMDWRRKLSDDIRTLRAVAGAEQVTVTLTAEQADALARGLDLWANCTPAPRGISAARVIGDRA